MVNAELDSRMVRFGVTGVSVAGLFFGLAYGLVRSGLSPFASSLTAYAMAVAVGYALQQGWTFGARHRHRRSFPRYLLLQLGCCLLSGLTAHVAVNQFGQSALSMSVITTLSASILSVIGSFFWVFPRAEGASPMPVAATTSSEPPV